ncbi:MAG: hypothetical protein CL677_02125, partial [Bdellovibrionaceae bacterium]|nr:hypothetical protein [Pseudobdellovibrionaceae bacterium]
EKKDDQNLWLVTVHDVTVEDQLHSKYHHELKEKEELIEELEAAKWELESYNKNLEMIISERTKELRDSNSTLHAMMDSLGQGFLIIDADGICGSIYTKSCARILEEEPEGKPLWDVLDLKNEDAEQVKLWVSAVFQEALPFESLEELGPKVYNHSESKHITLDFFPIRDPDEQVQNIVMVATDKTAEVTANIAMEKEKQHSQMVLKVVRNKEQFSTFLNSIEAKINNIVKFTRRSDEEFNVDEILRYLHTFEGECGVFSVHTLGYRARRCQEVLSPLKSVWAEDLRVVRGEFNVEVAELTRDFEEFIRENQKTFQKVGIFDSRKIEIKKEAIENFYSYISAKDLSKDLIEKFEYEFIKEPVRSFIKHYEDVIQTVAAKQDKKVSPLEYIGCDERIRGDYLRPFFDVLVHAFRNAVDHGIESPEERVQQGKKPMGNVSVEFSEMKIDGKNAMKFVVRDDGRGIDPEQLKGKVKMFHPELDVNQLSDHEIIQNIFEPGFTSKDSVEEFSGRGVGMDAIKNLVESMGGDVMITSIVGQGSTLSVIIPIKNKTNNDQIRRAS